MPHKSKFFVVFILIVMIISFCGCNQTTLEFNEEYTEYVYIGSEGIFNQSGRVLTINSDNTFSMKLDDEISLSGVVEHITREQTIYLDCDENTVEVVKQRFRDKILEDPENSIPIEILDTMLEGIDIREEVHYDKEYLFTTSFISAHRYIDTSLYSANEDYSKFEGVYSVKNYDGLMLLKNGNIYVQDVENPESGVFPILRGSYILANDFVTMTINDEEGNPQPAQKYLVADLIVPFDLEIDENQDNTEEETEEDIKWYDSIKDDLELLEGKKIKVLVLCFYSTNAM